MTASAKLAVVTGGCSGLGQASAEFLLANGWHVVIFDLNKDSGDEIAQKMHPSNCWFDYVDVTSSALVEAAVNKLAGKEIRLLINCAGVAPAKRTLNREGEAMPLDDFAKVININLVGSFNVARVVAAAMAKNSSINEDRGCIINTASVAGYEGQIGQTAYAASKAGLIGLSLPMARDLAPLGIRVNAIAPGIMGTPMLLAMPDKVQEALASNVQHPKRLGIPEEFAKLAMHIAENSYINGETIRLDGALRMPPK
ncbi:SDR family NAD(P)-dependent oxidoreductase [Glaciecola petra]|uniref:SDR family NAD(P)-dependent oxidoreductase n=1 Tax=Glaciecola petra TaxID=3075602 RepID=A0ABU2ZPG0_9ALTE|nr:SDR family NAD(P)-dependent oxidoreductase [Aestuariibacter sp. P117]MDT0594508.1 SDR family NAD(P)-dependent oxidoreductase [Aestuariibacter sp. P117]